MYLVIAIYCNLRYLGRVHTWEEKENLPILAKHEACLEAGTEQELKKNPTRLKEKACLYTAAPLTLERI